MCLGWGCSQLLVAFSSTVTWLEQPARGGRQPSLQCLPCNSCLQYMKCARAARLGCVPARLVCSGVSALPVSKCTASLA